MSRDDDCPWALNLTEAEGDALEWLEDTLRTIAGKSRHRNCRRAKLALAAVSRAMDRGVALHNRIHELEVMEMVIEATAGSRTLN